MAKAPPSLTLDEATFGPMSEELRRDLLLHCYRFTGSLHDAEDLVQETLAKAWHARAQYRGEAGLRTWLRRIATHVCLDFLRRNRARRTLPSQLRDADRARDVLWLEPLPADLYADAHADPAAAYDLRESVSLAFLTALQALAPRQRAVLIMRDVLAVPAKETAETLEISVSSVNSLLHRARQKLRGQYSRPSAGATTDPQAADLLRRYVGAWEAGDIEGLMGLLKAGTTLEMPPIRYAVIGVEAIRRFLAPAILDGTPYRWRALITEANSSAAIALYERATSGYRFTGLQLITADGKRIATITAYMDATLAAGLHLPPAITG